MNVHLSFDIEIWCSGWDALDASFPRSFERYVYGESKNGQYALPKTLEILNRYGLKGVFFVEPLFAARFGTQHLNTIVNLIRDAGQDVQLHLHPEWTDEIQPPIIEDSLKKRQHLAYYSLQEQTALIAFGRKLLEEAGSGPISVFRAGSFAANLDTFEALRRNQIMIDSSLNGTYDISGKDLRSQHAFSVPFVVNGISTYPVTVFKDGYGRDRPAHVGACSFAEMTDALWSAKAAGASNFVVVSHNFEMLKPGTAKPSWIVVRRFEQLCTFLCEHQSELPVTGYSPLSLPPGATLGAAASASAKFISTTRRHVEQILCKFP